jgi:hypothetical protein
MFRAKHAKIAKKTEGNLCVLGVLGAKSFANQR